ncbi:MAG: UDP-N-acetylglucosamine 1-carboxyvinyltransferase [Lentisphaeria bacterium]
MHHNSGREYLKIRGGKPLSGSVKASGNKNAALPILAATLLTDEEMVLDNVPNIGDVRVMLEVLAELGCEVKFDGERAVIKAANLKSGSISREQCSKIRTSILFVAPLLHRFGHVEIFPPGGDVIGRRRLDAHFYGLETLGAKTHVDGSFIFDIEGRFHGRELFFDEASVTATEHILMAAVIAEGTTIIRNAASEPHVQDLARMLISMGAHIEGLNTNTLTIYGVSKLSGCSHSICGDHIEAGSFLALGAATGGKVTVTGIRKSDFWMIRRVFSRFNVPLEFHGDSVTVPAGLKMQVQKDFGGAVPRVDDGPWPQFPSDLMSSIIIMATQAEGTILFFEKMFESRLYFVDRLIAMGASAIVCDPHRVVISGPAKLRPLELSSPDIRAGMALLTAALCADGESSVYNVNVIDRGYANLDEKLSKLGADIERCQ